MQRLNSVQPENAEARAKELLDTVQQAFGTVPNAAKVMANSPAVLQSFLGFSTAMGEARIGEKLHNQIKLNTSENNECEYCTSILSAVAPTAGLSAEEVLVGRTGLAEDTRIKAALTFANDVLETRGKVTDDQLASVKSAGFDDGQIVEVVASVVLGCFTNFLNNVADTQLDVPPAEAIEPSAACSSGACSVH
ncbi:carboxymuconolactone decarboxylase family protein [Bremerella sp. P1]|uniref:carboxymuconolactone decarboxylase family protein n=1 Tax=Bremerella sp. P1 TaxID=3026424 RepID=UPI0023683329|nr:carboxymuconolactone decarboxylase family protein [Bremerella sp. P1]WDI41968.1 carboxymuconolactone decarboxylase family protein [Bremerella sp. P1]